jgi:hypothetical protein
MSLPAVRPATEDDVANLRNWDGTYDSITHTIGNAQDIVANWKKLGDLPHPHPEAGSSRRVVLIERSSNAIAFVDGDGEHFGRVVLPSAPELDVVVRHFGLHWE